MDWVFVDLVPFCSGVCSVSVGLIAHIWGTLNALDLSACCSLIYVRAGPLLFHSPVSPGSAHASQLESALHTHPPLPHMSGLHHELPQSVYITNTSRFSFGFALQTLEYQTDCRGVLCLFQRHSRQLPPRRAAGGLL